MRLAKQNRTRIERTLELFEAARLPLFTVLNGVSRKTLDWNPAPEKRGIGKICRHLFRVDVWFLKRLGITPVISRDAPGSAEEIAGRMRLIQEQIISEVSGCADDADLMRDRVSLEGKAAGARLGPDVVHIAQHYLYHLAQIVSLRRIREPEWPAPLDEWNAATRVIENQILQPVAASPDPDPEQASDAARACATELP